MAFKLPKKGFVFYPVATGDSTTIVVKDNAVIMQLDLHNCEADEDDDSKPFPIVDELVRLLPKKNNIVKPKSLRVSLFRILAN